MTAKIMSIILLLSMGFMACKKDDAKSKTTQEKLSGKWNFVSTISNHFYGGSSHFTNTTGAPGEYVDFRNDGKIYSYIIGAYDTVAYGIITESKIWIDNSNNTFDLKVFTDADLQLYDKEIINPSDYDEATINLKR